ncbi:hypothetical protein ONE63_002303 [Megalurothrips usitatus]|uniref:SET domain-containing protein n=1 Tax=Megalurothrips usitatus TaxID=439358 RepID=A0AAV7XBI8_9NEOP|nr:hypothetical protein ONE63_002303 [Megalurothrips usitatus]
MSVDGILGRHVVATRAISAGEVILRCRPLAVGPKATTAPVCLGCCRLSSEASDGEDDGPRHACGGCGWPLCSRRCQRSSLHREECGLLRAASSTASSTASSEALPYAAVLPLRCLLLRGRRRRAVRGLQSHLEERVRDSAPYQPHGAQGRAAAFVREPPARVEDEALRMAAILDTNAFDVSRDGTEARALFGSVSMLSHDCRANARCAMLGLQELGVLAQRDIAAGDVISISYYGDGLRGALQRRRHLRATKCFDCRCARCADPTDLGLRLDGVRCIRCNGREGRPALLQSEAPLDAAADWRCERCGFALSADQMEMGHRRLRAQVGALELEGGVVGAEAFLAEHLGPGGLLHPTSAHVLRVKLGLLAGVYAHIPGCTPPPDVDDASLARGVAMCEELLAAVAVLDPGLSALRGSLLLRLHGLVLERARRAATSTASGEDVQTARRLFRETETIFMDLETRTELQKRKAMAEDWIRDNIVGASS